MCSESHRCKLQMDRTHDTELEDATADRTYLSWGAEPWGAEGSGLV
jgi:hypothetical protein